MQKMLPTPVLYILLSLADEDRHGYAIMQHVREHTGGDIVLGPGELYTSLQRAVQAGYIREVGASRGQAADGRGKRAYRLTIDGRRAAERELARLNDVLRLARHGNLKPARDEGR